jgi:TRAP-type C4-dicarboxylate transport system permease small subunit
MESSMSPEEIKKRIRMIRNIHYAVFWLFFVGVGLMIFSQDLAVYSALAISSMGIVQARNKGDCPLTVEEHNARNQIGEVTGEKFFIKEVFKKHLNINISRFAINTTLAAAFALSGYTIVYHLIRVLQEAL